MANAAALVCRACPDIDFPNHHHRKATTLRQIQQPTTVKMADRFPSLEEFDSGGSSPSHFFRPLLTFTLLCWERGIKASSRLKADTKQHKQKPPLSTEQQAMTSSLAKRHC
jgi:hypothetical protein